MFGHHALTPGSLLGVQVARMVVDDCTAKRSFLTYKSVFPQAASLELEFEIKICNVYIYIAS